MPVLFVRAQESFAGCQFPSSNEFLVGVPFDCSAGKYTRIQLDCHSVSTPSTCRKTRYLAVRRNAFEELSSLAAACYTRRWRLGHDFGRSLHDGAK